MRGRKTLVLGLDEIFVHSVFGKKDDADIFVTFEYESKYHAVSTYVRPFTDFFLEYAFENFEVVFYSSAIYPYANQILNYLDSEGKSVGRLFRDNCITRDGIYIKTIDKLKRNPVSLIIIDNNPLTLCFNSENVFPIKSWFSNPNDTELKDIIPILKSLSKVKDVRKIIKQVTLKLSSSNDEMNKMINNQYQLNKNIKIADRPLYISIIGNYYPPQNEYNLKKLKTNFMQSSAMMTKMKSARPSVIETNAYLFNHLH